jgi:hypothetical protein
MAAPRPARTMTLAISNATYHDHEGGWFRAGIGQADALAAADVRGHTGGQRPGLPVVTQFGRTG